MNNQFSKSAAPFLGLLASNWITSATIVGGNGESRYLPCQSRSASAFAAKKIFVSCCTSENQHTLPQPAEAVQNAGYGKENRHQCDTGDVYRRAIQAFFTELGDNFKSCMERKDYGNPAAKV
ncbi:MAG: hypothetical protein U1F27_12635 [Turneriella sp.]